MSEVVSEKDKPFILSLIFVIGMFALLAIGAVGAFNSNSFVTEYIDKIITSVVAVVGMIVTFYFKTKE